MLRYANIGVAALCTHALGCSAEGGFEGTEFEPTEGPSLNDANATENTDGDMERGDEEVFEGESADLHVFDINGEVIKFTSVETPEGDTDLIISVALPDFRATNAIDLINAEGEDVTDLERFYALAGRDAEPHPVLLEHHILGLLGKQSQ